MSDLFGLYPEPPHRMPEIGDCTHKEEVLEFVRLCETTIDREIGQLDLEAASGFYGLPFNKLELQLYNLRYLQHHTAQLIDPLLERADIHIGWVGMRK